MATVNPAASRLGTGRGTRPTMLGPFPGSVDILPRFVEMLQRIPLQSSITPPPQRRPLATMPGYGKSGI